MRTAETIDHGEYRGYLQHRKWDVPVTDDCGCRQANTEYKLKNQRDRAAAGLPDNNNRARRRANAERRTASV